MIAGGAAAVLVAAIVAVVLVVSGGGSSSPSASASDRNAPADLVKAANDVGFHPNTEAGVGEVEDKPASAGTAPTTDLLPAGTKAPDFTLKTPEGKTYSLKQFRGKTVLLEFFATWCPHCDAEAPYLKKLDRKLPNAKFQFIGINADGEDAASVYAYHRYFDLPFPSLLDPSAQPGSFHAPGAAGPVTTQYRVGSFPTFYVIDPTGTITFRTDGEQPNALLERELRAASQPG